MKIERWNTPGTADTPENTEGGILIVMPPVWGPEKREGESEPKARGLIVSAQIDRGPVIPECLRWLERSGLEVRELARAFSILVWPSEPICDAHGPQTVPRLVGEKAVLLDECRRRRPKILIFLSCYLYDAFRDPSLADEVRELFGSEIDKSRRLTSTRLRTEAMRLEKALVLGLPLPSRNTTPAFVEALVKGLSPIMNGLRRKA